MSASVDQVSDKVFDYVVVGGGVAGLTAAARLANDPSITVVVLEAGPQHIDDPLIDIPAQFGVHIGNPKYDWCFNTTPQPHANNKTYAWARGKMLGGSSAMNFYMWSKPPAVDIDAWEKLGNHGWNWARFHALSKQVESFTEPKPDLRARYRQFTKPTSHGQDGPLKTMFPEVTTAADIPFQDSMHALGIKDAKDPYGGDPVGTFMAVSTLDPKTHTRSYAVTASYTPNKDKPNFTVLCEAFVHRLVTRSKQAGEGKDDLLEATGVEFAYLGKSHVVHARKEVLLCAGALKSPQILELSGIGDRRILDPLGIQTKIDLPGVGANVQEHNVCPIIFELNTKHSYDTLDRLKDEGYAAEQLKLHAEKKGLYCTGIGGFTFVPLNLITVTPDVATALIAAQRKHVEEKISSGGLPPGLKEQWLLQLERLEQGSGGDCEVICFPKYYGEAPDAGKEYLTIMGAVNSPFSRGTVHITSNDPGVQPAMDPHYFEEDFGTSINTPSLHPKLTSWLDLQKYAEIIKFIRRLPETESFKDIIVGEVFPGGRVSTHEEVCNYIKDTMGTTYHTASTAAMMPREKNGVVNTELRVYGTSNVRVADLSIVPLHVAAHTQCSAYVIGTAVAEIIQKNM